MYWRIMDFVARIVYIMVPAYELLDTMKILHPELWFEEFFLIGSWNYGHFNPRDSSQIPDTSRI